jgi:hypothetical protein
MNHLTFFPRVLLLFLILSAFFVIVSSRGEAQIGCPSLKPVITGADPLRSQNAWQKNASVVVNIIDNPPNNGVNYAYSSREKQAIETAFTSWSASLLTCANVTFTFITGAAGSGNLDFSSQYVAISKATLPLNPDGTPTIADNQLASTGVFLHHANILTDVRITNLDAFKKTIAHEAGHTFGLRHCITDMACGSVMDNSTGYNDSLYGFESPTTCDITAAKNAGNYCPIQTPTPTTPTPTPLPTPIPGGCNGGPDFDLYPGTGCATGFVNSGNSCVRSTGFAQQCNRFGGYDFDSCECTGGCFDGGGCSPIVIDTQGNGFSMTDNANGVDFDLNNDGLPHHISWTALNSDDAWLALDRNNNGMIDSGRELFGNVTPQPPPPDGEDLNGFRALAEYDTAGFGGNGDGKITQQDAIFSRLRLWQDKNHNGVSDDGEVFTLPQLGLRKIDLDYRASRRTDEYGNQFKYRAKVRDAQDAQLGRWAWDVYLITQ